MEGSDNLVRSHRGVVELSLACLAHPVSLLSLGVLLLNDHYLKSAFTCWWTGKLSDFSALLFFPFLMTAVLALGFPGLNPRLAGWLAACLTGIGFAAIKTSTAINALAVRISEALAGAPVSILRDPSDLIALASLAAAIALWEHEAARPRARGRASPLGWTALTAAALGTLATSMASQDVVVRIVADRDALYAVVIGDYFEPQDQPSVIEPQDLELFRSLDGGETWEAAQQNAASLLPEGIVVEALPFELADPSSPEDRFRLTSAGRIERSAAGAAGGERSWEVDWEIPPHRRSFLERTSGPLALFHAHFSEERPGELLVAAGRHGVLRRSSSGRWTAHTVGNAAKPVFYTTDAGEILGALGRECSILILLMLFFAVALSVIGWAYVGRGAREAVWPAWAFFAASLGAIPVLATGFGFSSPSLQDFLGPALLVAVPGLFVVALVVPWRRLVALAADRTHAARARSVWWKTTLLLGFAPMLPLALWPPGILPWYELALALAALAWIAILARGGRALLVHARRSAQPGAA